MKVWRRIQYAFRSRRNEADLAEELAHHQALKQQEYESSGMSRADATFAAHRAIGNAAQIKEDSRQVWLTRHVENLLQDVRYAIRTLAKNPGFISIAVIALTLGIGLNTIVFTVFNALVLAPWSVRDPATVVGLFRAPNATDRRPNYSGFSYTSVRYLQDHSKKLAQVAATSSTGPTRVNDGATVRGGAYVTGNYLSMLGADMAVGRSFLPEEDSPADGKPVVVLNYSFWANQFGKDPGIVGRTIKLNYSDFLVIGVTAPGFAGTSAEIPAFWIPMNAMKLMDPGRAVMLTGNDYCCFDAYGRLAPGVTRTEAAAEASVLLDQYRKSIHSDENRKVYATPATFISTPDKEAVVYPIFGLVLGAVTLVLLIACANIANLLLARATARQREIGIRLSIGASRRRIIRQLLTESLIIALAGSALALVLASTLTGPLMLQFAKEPLAFDFKPDLRVFFATGLVAVLATLAFGLIPALHATRPNLNSALHSSAFLTGRLSTSRMRSILLGAQVALSLVLLVGAGLMTRSLQHAHSVDPGFAVNNISVVSIDLRLQGYKDEQTAPFWHDLKERVAAVPGVRSVAHVFVVPLGSQRAMTGGSIDGKSTNRKDSVFSANWVSPEYLRTLQIPIVAGRDFKQGDKKVMIINQAMAAKFWPDTNPIGHFVQTGPDRWDVIGVAKVVRSIVLSSPDEPYAYLVSDGGMDHRLIVRADGDPLALAAGLPKVVTSVNPRVRSTVSMLSENLKNQIDRQRDLAAIAGTLGLLALTLACIGVYGVVAYAVQQRTREIGVRMALGATKSHVLSTVLMQNVRVVATGAAIGLAAAAGVSRVITSYLYGLSPLDPVSFGAVLAALIASAMIASYLPARRAVSVDPSSALRHE